MKKTLSLFLVLIMVITGLLTGCSGGGTDSASGTGGSGGTDGGSDGSSAEGKIQLDFWSFWGSEQRRPVIQHMVDAFNKSQDKIHVKYTYLPWGDVWTKELAAVAAGNPPDAIIQDIMSVPIRGSKEQATNLSQFIKQEDSDISKRFYPQLWNMMKYKDGVYGLPFNTDTRILFYNKDLFKKAGLDPNKPPQTWDELWEYANKLDQKSGDNYNVVGFYPLWGVGKDFWMENADGAAYFNDKMQPVIDDPTNVETMNWLKKWINKYGWDTINRYKSLFKQKTSDPFFSGKIGMIVMTATSYTEIRDFAPDLNFGVTLIPERKPGSGHRSWGGGFDIEIPKGSDHPEAAWKFVKFMTSKKPQKYWATHTFDNVANIAAAEATAKSSDLSKEEQMVYSTAAKSVEHNVMTPRPLKAPNFTNKVNPILDNSLHGKIPPQQAVEKAQKLVEKLLQGN